MDVILSGTQFAVAMGVVWVAYRTARRLRGSTLFWAAAVFVFTGLTCAAHALAEMLGLGAGMSAVSSYVAAILLFFSIVGIDLSTKVLGVR